MLVAIGSDHRGYAHKKTIADALRARGIDVRDEGCPGPEAADYPVPALAVGEAVAGGEAQAGILICGSGIGMSIAANKVRGVRASLCATPDQARLTRQHNDSNVLCLGGDALAPELALAVVDAWLEAAFEGGRHARRVDLITSYEDEHTQRERD